MKKVAAVFTLLAVLGLGMVACKEDDPDCIEGPYQFDTNVDRCRDSSGRFADTVCCD